MLDVHPPHEAVHTPKDFFVHMATICLGLLIALGLEQAAEYVHHEHQRHQLEQDLHAEAIQNLRIALYNMDRIQNIERWQTQQVAELDRAAEEGRTPRDISNQTSIGYRLPSDAVWTVAQTGTLNLLPRTEAQEFAHPYAVEKFAADDVPRMNLLLSEYREILDAASCVSAQAPGANGDNSCDLSRLSKQNLAHLREVAASIVALADQFENDNINLYGFTWGTLHGYSDDENFVKRFEVFKAFRQGGTAAILTKFPIPDENTASSQEGQ